STADEHQAAPRPWHRALDQQQAVLGLHVVHGQALRGDPLVAHPARHPHALEHTARGGAATDRAGRTVGGLVTVAGALAGEAVALHDTGVALALAGAGHVDLGTRGEDVGGDLLADLVVLRVAGAQLGEVTLGRDTRLLEVAGQRGVHHPVAHLARGLAGLAQLAASRRAVHLARVHVAVGQLHRGVAVVVLGPDLGHHVRPRLDDGDRYHPVLLVEDLGHTELGAQDPLHLPVRHVAEALTGC